MTAILHTPIMLRPAMVISEIARDPNAWDEDYRGSLPAQSRVGYGGASCSRFSVSRLWLRDTRRQTYTEVIRLWLVVCLQHRTMMHATTAACYVSCMQIASLPVPISDAFDL